MPITEMEKMLEEAIGYWSDKDKQKTGKLVGIRVTDDSNDIMMITDTGTIIRISVKDVSVLGRSTQGVTLMRTNDGGKVVSIELVEPEETNEE